MERSLIKELLESKGLSFEFLKITSVTESYIQFFYKFKNHSLPGLADIMETLPFKVLSIDFT